MNSRSAHAATVVLTVLCAALLPVHAPTAQAASASSGCSAQQHSSQSASSKPASASSKKSSATMSCIQKAVLRREEAISASLDAFYADLSRMLELRKSLIVKYWGEKDEKKRDTGLSTVWKSFGQAWRTSGLYMKAERKKAWAQYRIDRSDCGFGIDDPEAGGLSIDSQY